MEIRKLTERNLTIAFLKPFYTTTHLIFGENRVYVCDTFLGSESMKVVAKIIKENGHQDKPVVVFNSHADWDHIWGNCYFKDAMILAHTDCKIRMEKEWDDELKRNLDYKQGDIIQTLPTTTFEDNFVFEDDDVEFFHSPGHTHDSSSCYDRKDRVLFVGDNIESEIPHVNTLDFDVFILTLEKYMTLDWKFLVSGHDPVQSDDSLIQSNLNYLRDFRDWKIDITKLGDAGFHVHLHSLRKLVHDITLVGVTSEIRLYFEQVESIVKSKLPSDKTQEYLAIFQKITD